MRLMAAAVTGRALTVFPVSGRPSVIKAKSAVLAAGGFAVVDETGRTHLFACGEQLAAYVVLVISADMPLSKTRMQYGSGYSGNGGKRATPAQIVKARAVIAAVHSDPMLSILETVKAAGLAKSEWYKMVRAGGELRQELIDLHNHIRAARPHYVGEKKPYLSVQKREAARAILAESHPQIVTPAGFKRK